MLTMVSRPKDLSTWDRAPMLQGVLHPGQPAEADLWGCQARLQDGWRRVAQHWNGERAATDGEVHTAATGWRWRLLDRAPPQPTSVQSRDHKPRLPLTVLLAGWKQGQVQVFLFFFSFNILLFMYEYFSCIMAQLKWKYQRKKGVLSGDWRLLD